MEKSSLLIQHGPDFYSIVNYGSVNGMLVVRLANGPIVVTIQEKKDGISGDIPADICFAFFPPCVLIGAFKLIHNMLDVFAN